MLRVIEFTHVCSSLFSTHMRKRTHAKHRLAVITHWPCNRCCEQCESRVTPALLCCSTSSLVHGPTSRESESHSSCLSPSTARPPRPGHFPSHAPHLFLHLVSTQRPKYRDICLKPKKTQTVSVFLHTLCVHEVLLIYLKPICEFKSLKLHVNIDKQQS